jgi:hypothetical protein
MRFIRTLLAAAAGIASVAVVPGVARACSCVPPPPPKKAVADYDVVFAGTVAEVEDSQAGARIVSSGGAVHYTFALDAVAKGPRVREIQVSSALGGASCGANFRKGRRYLVFAYYGSDFERIKGAESLWTNLCTPNERLKPDEALPIAARRVAADEIVGPPPNPPAPGPPVALVAAAACIALIVLAGLVLVVRSRSAPGR